MACVYADVDYIHSQLMIVVKASSPVQSKTAKADMNCPTLASVLTSTSVI